MGEARGEVLWAGLDRSIKLELHGAKVRRQLGCAPENTETVGRLLLDHRNERAKGQNCDKTSRSAHVNR